VWDETQVAGSVWDAAETVAVAWLTGGRSEDVRAWLQAMARWHHHPLTGNLAKGTHALIEGRLHLAEGHGELASAAAHRAAEEASRNLRGARASAVLLFDCVCRGMILDQAFGREIQAVQTVFPDVPVAGLLTYGEIARFKGRLEGWHNTTAVVAAIPA